MNEFIVTIKRINNEYEWIDYLNVKNSVIIPEIFEDFNIDIEQSNINYQFKFNKKTIKIKLKSGGSLETIEKSFWLFYDYFGFILGYYPEIKETVDMNKKYSKNINSKYITDKRYIRNTSHYINKMSSEDIKASFMKFIEFKKSNELQIAMYNISMMKSNEYAEIAIVQLLQAFDGIYNSITFLNKDNNKIPLPKKYFNNDTEKIINDVIDNLNFEKIFATIDSMNNLNDKETYICNINKEIENFKNNIKNINNYKYKTKLKILFENVNDKIFQFERMRENNTYSLEEILQLFKETRNKLSHANNLKGKKMLNGKESKVYIFKLIAIFRFIIFKEIGIYEKYICNELLDKDIEMINSMIRCEILNEAVEFTKLGGYLCLKK